MLSGIRGGKTHGGKLILYSVCLIALCVVLLFPLLYMSGYAAPVADDYDYVNAYTAKAWNESHSLLELLKAAGKTVADQWLYWQGTYSSVFLMSLQPGLFNPALYPITCYVMVGMLLLSVLLFFNGLFYRILGMRKLYVTAFSMAVALYMVERMPCIQEGVYWFNGAVHYTFFFSVFLLTAYLILVLENQITQEKGRYCAMTALCALSGFILAGGSLPTAFGAVLLLLAWLIICWIKKRDGMWCRILIFSVVMIGFGINVFAPGNAVRQSNYSERPGFWGTIIACFRNAVVFVSQWSTLELLLCLVLLSPILFRIAKCGKRYGFQFKRPAIVMLSSFCYLSALMAPPLYAMGSTGAGRLINVIFFTYIILVALNAAYLIGWFLVRYYPKRELSIVPTVGWLLPLTASIVVLLMCCTPHIHSYTAMNSIVDGELAEYGQQMAIRTEMVRLARGNNIALSRFTAQPELLRLDELSADHTDWRNKSYAQYHHLNTVRLLNESSTILPDSLCMQDSGVLAVCHPNAVEGEPTQIEIWTTPKVQRLFAYINDQLICELDALDTAFAGNSVVQKWKMVYSFEYYGAYQIEYHAYYDDENMRVFYDTIPVTRPAVIDWWYNVAVESQPFNAYVYTDQSMHRLFVYHENELIAEFQDDDVNVQINEDDSHQCREWVVPLTFDFSGIYYLGYDAAETDKPTGNIVVDENKPLVVHRNDTTDEQ